MRIWQIYARVDLPDGEEKTADEWREMWNGVIAADALLQTMLATAQDRNQAPQLVPKITEPGGASGLAIITFWRDETTLAQLKAMTGAPGEGSAATINAMQAVIDTHSDVVPIGTTVSLLAQGDADGDPVVAIRTAAIAAREELGT